MNALSPQTRIRQADRVAARTVDGKAVVVVIDTRKLHVINPVGTRVWELADGRTLSDIVGVIVEEFDVDPETAEHDVLGFVTELAAVGAVDLQTDARPAADAGGNR